MIEAVQISTVIPAYNAAATLAETLDSVAAQSLSSGEVIVVDDGSTDDTARIAAAHPLRPRVLAKLHSGAASSVNLGIGNSRGAFLAFVDADDLWARDKLRLQAEYLEAHPEIAGVAGHVALFACPSMSGAEAARFIIPPQPQPGWVLGAMLIRSSIFDQVGGFPEDLANGHFIDWFDRAKAAGARFHMAEDLVLKRRIRPGSLAARNPGSDASMLEMARRAILRRRKAH